MKKIFSLIILFLCFVTLSGCEKEILKISYTVTLDNGTVEKFSFEEIKTKAFENEINWNSNYMGRKVSFSGTVENIQTLGENVLIYFVEGIPCEIDKDSSFYIETKDIESGDNLTCSAILPANGLYSLINLQCNTKQ